MESPDHPKFLLFWPAGGGLGGVQGGAKGAAGSWRGVGAPDGGGGGGGGSRPKSLLTSGLPSNLQVEAT